MCDMSNLHRSSHVQMMEKLGRAGDRPRRNEAERRLELAATRRFLALEMIRITGQKR
jgi:hypothetical protein